MQITSPPPAPTTACAVCGGSRLHYLFSVADTRAVRCDDCQLIVRDPRTLSDPSFRAATVKASRGEYLPYTVEKALDALARYRGAASGALAVIGHGGEEYASRAQAAGYMVASVNYTDPASLDAIAGQKFDVAVLYNVLDTVLDPPAMLKQARTLLAPDGTLVVMTYSFDDLSRLNLRNGGADFHQDQYYFFTHPMLETMLIHNGFAQIIKRLGMGDPTGGKTGGMMLMARPHEQRVRQKLSLVVPAFNEAKTFVTNFDKLLAKAVEGLDIEIIVVESNSTDGTRELVRRYENEPRVTVVWEDRPQGKGHAVRGGLQRITGDYVLIQDADLEYDLEDYEALLEPLVQGRAAFVLGARHGGSAWKMRSFTGQPVVSAILNSAHWFFTILVNVGFHARLKDPFTMYKVFRRDCLYGLNFECNRFDFDFELVIKLLRKGYQPLEIPVNYRSRSFTQGKKVSFFRDPMTWLRALIKFRLESMDPLENIVQDRRYQNMVAAGARPKA